MKSGAGVEKMMTVLLPGLRPAAFPPRGLPSGRIRATKAGSDDIKKDG
jgi:hypothetical protein